MFKNIKKRINYLKSIYEIHFIHKKLKNLNNKNIKKYPQLATYSFDPIGTEISIYGQFEKKELQNLKDCIFNNLNTKNSICIDVGANIGNHTLNFSNYFKHTYAYEPHPDTFQLLKFNTRNKNKISIYNYGLSDKNEEIVVRHNKFEPHGEFSINFNDEKKNNLNSVLYDEHLVKLKIFDEIFINTSDKISFIKIDVEDFELNVLKGMKKTLSNHSPIIFFEQYQNQFIKNDNIFSSPVIDYLKENGYNYFYEQSYARKWRFSNNYFPILNKISKLFELFFLDLPTKENKLLLLNEFSKKDYNIIASKSKLN